VLDVGIVSLLLASAAAAQEDDDTGGQDHQSNGPGNQQDRRPIDRAGSRRNQVQGAETKIQLAIFGSSRYRLPFTILDVGGVAAGSFR